MSAVQYLSTTRVWVQIGELQWVQGEVVHSTAAEVEVQLQNGQKISLPRDSPRVRERNPPHLENSENLIILPQLDEPNILWSLFVRYRQEQIYTLTGPILIALNPWREVPLYNNTVMSQYQGTQGEGKSPHIFGIADSAYFHMKKDRKDQSILVSGDSGSGKTETTKFVMSYLAVVGGTRKGQGHSIEQQVLQSNPVLEAFGNAKTLRNDNSSRFVRRLG